MIPGPVFLGMTGWLALVVMVAALCVPLGIKALHLGGAARSQAMRYHYALGIAVPLIAVAHAWIPIASGQILHIFGTGIALGFGGFAFLLVQCGLGAALYRRWNRKLRRAHLFGMMALVTLLGFHAWIYALR